MVYKPDQVHDNTGMWLKSVHLTQPKLPTFKPFAFSWATSLVRLHIRRGQTGGFWWGEEIAEALLGQVSVLIVVEGLSWQLAEKVGTVSGAASATAPTQRTMRGCERLCAAAAAYTTRESKNINISVTYCIHVSEICKCQQMSIFELNIHHSAKSIKLVLIKAKYWMPLLQWQWRDDRNWREREIWHAINVCSWIWTVFIAVMTGFN